MCQLNEMRDDDVPQTELCITELQDFVLQNRVSRNP